MKLELMVEEETSEEVVKHLVTVISENIPPINQTVVKRYKLADERTIPFIEMLGIAYSKVPNLDKLTRRNRTGNWGERYFNSLTDNQKTSLFVPDVDLMIDDISEAHSLAKRNLGTNAVRNYSHLGSLITNHTTDADLSLVGIHGYWFVVTPSKFWMPLQGHLVGGSSNIQSGVWFGRYNTGVARLSKKPGPGNKSIVLHELGHAVELDHHKNCVMAAGGRTDIREYCGNCKEKLNAFAEAA